MPFPSLGCQTCKIRRIKCDEAQPVCKKCIKSQRICQRRGSGEGSFLIHVENSFAKGSEKRPRGPRSSPSKELTSIIPTPLSRTSTDLNTHAVTFYVRFHLQKVADIPGILHGISDDVLPIWTSKVEHPILDVAVSSMALAVFSNAQHDPPAAIEASVKYQKLLQMTQMTISNLDKNNIDACLLAVWIMSRYEHANHRLSHLKQRMPFLMQLRSIKHHDGALAILKIWKDRLSHDQPVSDVIKHTRRSMIKSALLRSLAIPDWLLDGASFAEYELDLDFDRIMVKLANLRQRLFALLHDETNPGFASPMRNSELEELSCEAQDLDEEIDSWATQIPSDWSFQPHELPDTQIWPTPDFHSPLVYTYSSLAHAAVWNHYYATRMLINSTWLKILSLNPPEAQTHFQKQRSEILYTLHTMSNNLASSIPFCLQKLNSTPKTTPSSPQQQPSISVTPNQDLKPYVASLVIWPLSIASGLRTLDVGQQIWFRSQLARLGRLISSRFFECADTNHWLEL